MQKECIITNLTLAYKSNKVHRCEYAATKLRTQATETRVRHESATIKNCSGKWIRETFAQWYICKHVRKQEGRKETPTKLHEELGSHSSHNRTMYTTPSAYVSCSFVSHSPDCLHIATLSCCICVILMRIITITFAVDLHKIREELVVRLCCIRSTLVTLSSLSCVNRQECDTNVYSPLFVFISWRIFVYSFHILLTVFIP